MYIYTNICIYNLPGNNALAEAASSTCLNIRVYMYLYIYTYICIIYIYQIPENNALAEAALSTCLNIRAINNDGKNCTKVFISFNIPDVIS
jgi:hypothetical protein